MHRRQDCHQSKKGNSRKGSEIPMKVRRRQSDARWRANVASCYETLKHVIPINIRASKRQISKAFILQETSKHINFLEDVISQLLQEKLRLSGQEDNMDEWCQEQVANIKEQFQDKQRCKVDNLNNEKRYKRNKYKLFSSDQSVKESKANANSHTFKAINKKKTGNKGKGRKATTHESRSSKKKPNRTKSNLDKASIKRSKDQSSSEKSILIDNNKKNICMANDAPTSIQNDIRTPMKQSGPSGLFTPVKLPTNWDQVTPVKNGHPTKQLLPDTPSSQITESAYGSDMEIVDHDLRCCEHMWLSDEEEEPDICHMNEHTPGHFTKGTDISGHVRKRRRYRCMSECSEACVPDIAIKQLSMGNMEPAHREKFFSPSPRCRRSLQEALNLPDLSPPITSPLATQPDLHCSESSSPIDPSFQPNMSRKSHIWGLETVEEFNPTRASALAHLKTRVSVELDEECLVNDPGFFDGYLLFYRRMLDEIKKQAPSDNCVDENISPLIYQMWKEMDPNHKKVMVDLAALEDDESQLTLLNSSLSDDSALSEDLRELQVSPLHPEMGIKTPLDKSIPMIWPLQRDLDLIDMNATDEPFFKEDLQTTQLNSQIPVTMKQEWHSTDPSHQPTMSNIAKVIVVKMPAFNQLGQVLVSKDEWNGV